PDDYVHRIGRTGRAGAKGRAFTLVADEDAEAIANVEKLTGSKIKVFGKDDVRVELADPSTEADKSDTPSEEKPRRSRKSRDEADRSAPGEGDADRGRKPRKSRTNSGDDQEASSPPRKSRSRRRHDDDNETVPAGEWNGPKPGFLDVGFRD
ncbi:MAG: DEAD/DEAH box helicase, partial [Erythrobacter sp.]|nr:DEAD/DEAH box helicase [Erythrobacter sp.]